MFIFIPLVGVMQTAQYPWQGFLQNTKTKKVFGIFVRRFKKGSSAAQ